MGSFIRVSTGNMQGDADRIREEASHIPQAVEQLADALNALASCWEGPAKSTYLDQVSKDIECMEEVCGILQKFIEDFDVSINQYDTCENNVYDTMGRIHFW